MKKREQGILSVEASIVLTFMTLFVLFLFGFARVYRAQNLVSHATLQTADAVALESYLRETALQSDVNDVVHLASSITDSDAISAESLESLRSADLPKIAKEKFVAAISNTEAKADEKLKSMGVKNGLSGIDFTECKMDLSNDDVIIAIKYTVEMQFPVFGANEIEVTKSSKAKTFGEILFEVSTEPNVPGWGTTDGDDKVVHGSTVQITATPNYGYVFVSWNDGVTDNPRTVTVTDAQHYTAIFKKNKFGVNLSVNNSSYGSVTGAGNYDYLDVATITATPNQHYQFAGWDDNGDGNIDNTNATRNITVDKTYSFKAVFKPVKYTISVKVNDNKFGAAHVKQGANAGTSIQADYGSSVQLICSSKSSTLYKFKNWSNGSTATTQTVTVQGNAEYIANFEYNTYTVSFYNGNAMVHQTTVIRGSSIDGSKSAVGSSMYSGKINKFSRWATSDNRTFESSTVVNSNLKVYAKIKYTVTLDPKEGSVSWTSKSAEMGQSITLPSPKLSNHTFKGWQYSGKNYSADKSYSFNQDITLTAKWSCNHKVGTPTGEKYEPYCSKLYSNGKLKAGAKLPWREYKCSTCGDKWKVTDESLRKHNRMNYKEESTKDDFYAYCNTKHADTHYGYCGSWTGESNGKYHTWDGHYHILCSYCHKEEQGYVWCYVDGELKFYDLHRCAKHTDKGSCSCPF